MSAITRYNATVTITREQTVRIPPASRNRFVFVARSVTPPPPLPLLLFLQIPPIIYLPLVLIDLDVIGGNHYNNSRAYVLSPWSKRNGD